jgi:prepilin peptidase CpaA
MIGFLAATCFSFLVILAGVGDVLSRRIPNWLCLLLAIGFLPLALASGMPWPDILTSAAVGLSLLLAGFILFSLGFLGGGDAKLIASAGLWLGLSGLPHFLSITVLVGAGIALIMVAWPYLALEAEVRNIRLGRLGAQKPTLPYGYSIAAGAVLSLPHSWWGAALGA